MTTPDDLEEGDEVELPTGERFIVEEKTENRMKPDAFEVTSKEDGREVTWRTHHVERAFEAGSKHYPADE